MKRICIFCGSRHGASPVYAQAVTRLGQVIGEFGFDIVFGGSDSGLMGIIANAVKASGHQVYGVTPFLDAEVILPNTALTQLIPVSSLSERKQKMEELSDAFIVLPGGFGTLDELFEVITRFQHGFHQKPIGLLNINGYFSSLIQFLEHACEQQFIGNWYKKYLSIHHEPFTLLEQLMSQSTENHRQ